MNTVPLGTLFADNVPGLDPRSFPSEEFELWSIPAFDLGQPDIVLGTEIGSAKKCVEPNDVLLSRIVPHIRRSWVVSPQNGRRKIASGEWIVFRNRRFVPEYLRHFLVSDPFHAQFMLTVAGVGGSLLRARPDRVAKIEIPLPPLDEQRRIAAILDQAAALCRARREISNKLETLPHALFSALFGDPAQNPFGFTKCLLGDIIDFVGGSQPPKSTFLYEEGPDRVRFVQIRDFRTDEHKTYVPRQLAKRPFTADDVMIGRYGPPVFQIFRGLTGTYNVALMKASPKDEISNDFIFYLLQEPKLHRYVVANSERTAGQSGVNLQLLENYPAYRPPIRLIKQFSEEINVVNSQLKAALEYQRKVEGLFASLQQRAFRGEL